MDTNELTSNKTKGETRLPNRLPLLHLLMSIRVIRGLELCFGELGTLIRFGQFLSHGRSKSQIGLGNSRIGVFVDNRITSVAALCDAWINRDFTEKRGLALNS